MSAHPHSAKAAAKPAWRQVSDPAAIADALLTGERAALARAITLVESTHADDRTVADALLARVLPRTGAAIRVGITGTPGVGKSTFIEAFGRHLTAAGHRVAVLAVDPSSARSGGSILGDKTRMTELARDPAAFIRPSPASGTLGGVARRTREAMLLAEAAGFDVVLVETVGVGQSETAVADMVDMFLLLLAPGGGDELQGIKRGIMELADLVVVNKADGVLLQPARLAATEYTASLHLMRPKSPAWSAKVLLASAVERSGMKEVWEAVLNHRRALEVAGELSERRALQAKAWLWSELSEGLTARFRQHAAVAAELPALEAAVAAGRMAPSAAARELLARFLSGGASDG